jgi:hypothetical protein
MTNVRIPIAGVGRASLKLLTLPFAMLPGSATRVDEREDTVDHPDNLVELLDEMGTTIGEAILDVGDDIEHVVVDSVEAVGEFVEESLYLVEDAFGGHRRVWEDDECPPRAD